MINMLYKGVCNSVSCRVRGSRGLLGLDESRFRYTHIHLYDALYRRL